MLRRRVDWERRRILTRDNQQVERALLSSAARLAHAESMDAILRGLADTLADASDRIHLVQLLMVQIEPAQRCILLHTVPDQFRSPEAPQVAHKADGASETLLNIARFGEPCVLSGADLPLPFDIPASRLGEIALAEAAAVTFVSSNPNERILALIYTDQLGYFAQIGLDPFIAYGELTSALLNQAAQRQRLNDYATFDHLTGLLNRRALAEILEREHVRADRHNRRYGILFFDLDHFKTINDRHGHSVGDLALQAVCRVANRVLREGDWLGRWGGEEFLCVLPDASDEEAVRVAERLRQEVQERPLVIDTQHPVLITLSIGVACFPQDGFDINSLLVHADAGLADAKRNGRNCVRRRKPSHIN